MKKSILLITPENKEIHKFRKKQVNNFIQITIPYLAGFIDESKYNIFLLDEYNQSVPFEDQFNLIAITVNTSSASHCYEIATRFRNKGAKVVFGGPHATLLPDEAINYCDYIIIGEGEETWPQFLEDFYTNKARKIYKTEGVPSLKGIPIPRRDLIKGRYLTKGAVFATRGCPYNCSYCNLKQIYSNSFRTRPIQEVIEDIKSINRKYFVFWDDNFFGDIEYAKALMKELGKLNKKWAAQVTLEACNKLGIDGVTVSILTPLPKTPLYDQFKKENRLLSTDWTYFNGKTRVAFKPKNMTSEELFEGYMWFRREFYSMKSIIKRLLISKTNIVHNFIVNLGYKFSIKETEFED